GRSATTSIASWSSRPSSPLVCLVALGDEDADVTATRLAGEVHAESHQPERWLRWVGGHIGRPFACVLLAGFVAVAGCRNETPRPASPPDAAAPLVTNGFGTVAGTVTDKTGAPVSAFTVAIRRLGYNPSLFPIPSTPGKGGVFDLGRIQAGRYALFAENSKTKQVAHVDITLAADQALRDVELVVGPGANAGLVLLRNLDGYIQ